MGTCYTARDIAFVIPTYNRPEKLRHLLRSFETQPPFGRVVVVGSGEGVGHVVASFEGRLPATYLHSEESGQILQRNIGLGMLGDEYALIGLLDDDIVLEPGAIAEMVELWNARSDLAGVGFNITNEIPPVPGRLQKLFFLGGDVPGAVLKSGFAVPFVGATEDRDIQWLGGGYTVWRTDVFHEFSHDEVKSSWAIGEDLRFSYPVGKKHALAVCSGARVRHEHVKDQAPPDVVHRYRGKMWGTASFAFVASHAELSALACLWMVLGKTVLSLVSGLLRRNRAALQSARGNLDSLWIFFKSFGKREALLAALSD